ncbi:MAG: hypothetical protein VX622_09825, partial [Pseudomonadota bacterium]|nr:hypothetical protein [Pseudomonadota bacterium]
GHLKECDRRRFDNRSKSVDMLQKRRVVDVDAADQVNRCRTTGRNPMVSLGVGRFIDSILQVLSFLIFQSRAEVLAPAIRRSGSPDHQQ